MGAPNAGMVNKFVPRRYQLNIISYTQDGASTEQVSVTDEIFRFQMQFAQATARFEVCNSSNGNYYASYTEATFNRFSRESLLLEVKTL